MYESSTCNLVLDANCFYMTLKSFQMFIPCVTCVTPQKLRKIFFGLQSLYSCVKPWLPLWPNFSLIYVY
jgi:hypothetical protein